MATSYSAGSQTLPHAETGALPIGKEQLIKLTQILSAYKAGKANTERRIVESENWWKLRNHREEARDSRTMAVQPYKSRSGWLHNVIMSKHADAIEAYPEPNIRAREESDRGEAEMLSSIIPCVLEQCDFERTYSNAMWQKCKTGTAIYKITWDKDKYGGMGDISITKSNPLNVYWEPGVEDIQRSRYFFSTELVDRDLLEDQIPELSGKLTNNDFISTKFLYDDTVSTDGKVTVIECYYHKGGRLQYVKYVNDIVLYATENDPQMAQRGLYDHGKYPYVFDVLFPVEGSPCGYGYVDLCKSPQTTIDMLNTAFVENAMVGAKPRYFKRMDGGINTEQFLDLTKSLVDVNGNLGEDAIRQIDHSPLDGMYVEVLDRTINELRETSGNTEASAGVAPSGVTAASAIAALQEASGKGSRDNNLASYRSFTDIVSIMIELIRQFYDLPRQFRIIGQFGMERYITYTNAGLRPQSQGDPFGINMGYRVPEFDIKISAQKKNVYTKVSQNELALQFFQMGFFRPEYTDQALMCLDIMDFDGKDSVMQKVSQYGTIYQKYAQYAQLALSLAAKYEPSLVQGLSEDIMRSTGAQPVNVPQVLQATTITEDTKKPEHPIVRNARAKAAASTQPDGGAVTGEAKG